MRNLCIFISLILFACEKMEVTPEYSFVRLNDDDSLSSCVNQEIECLPISDNISDIEFQIITDFPSVQFSTTRNRIVVLPCDGCADYTDEEVYEYAFGKEILTVVGSSDNGGLLRLGLSANFTDLAVGDYVYLSNACTAGAFDYAGTYEVTQIQTDTMRITVNTSFEGFIADDCNGGSDIYVTNFKKEPHLLSTTSIELEDDAEFEGDNYAWNLAEPFPTSELTQATLQCFRFCVYKVAAQVNLPGSLPTLISVTCLGTTNCFQKPASTCYTTKIVYGCDENAFGFYAGLTAPSTITPFQMSIRLPMWLYAPQYPGEEKGYQRSDGEFVKLSERINKTWTLETDWKEEQFHERLRVALSCDNIEVTNENAQLTDEGIYKKDEYSLEWSEEVKNYPFAKATTTVFKKLLSRSTNSNCA